MQSQPSCLTAAQRGALTRKQKAVAKRKADGIIEAGEDAQQVTANRAAEWVKTELLEDVPLLYTVKEMLEQGTLAQMLMPKHLAQGGEEKVRQKLRQGQKKFKQLADKNVATLMEALEPFFVEKYDGEGPHSLMEYLFFALQVEPDTDLPSKYCSECYFIDGLTAACVMRYEALGKRLQGDVPSPLFWQFDGSTCTLTVAVRGVTCSVEVGGLGFDNGSKLENAGILNKAKLVNESLDGGFLCRTLLRARAAEVPPEVTAAFEVSEKDPFDMTQFAEVQDRVRVQSAGAGDSVSAAALSSGSTPSVKRARSFELPSTSKISRSASFAAALLGTSSSRSADPC
eukprot:6491459-Amphidinium_carterae.1